MTSIFRYIQSYFHRTENAVNIDQYVSFDDGNEGGFPSDIVAFEYNPSNGALAVATSCDEVKLYGYQGATWSYNLNKGDLNNYSSGSISKLCFLSPNVLLALCRGPLVVFLQFKDSNITANGVVDYEKNLLFSWDCYHVQKSSNDSNALVFYMNSSVFRVKDDLTSELLILSDDIRKWCPEGSDIISITSVPLKPNFLLLFSDQGVVGVYRNSQFMAKLDLRNFEDEPVQRFHWSPNPNEAYGISANNKYTKWYVAIEEDGKLKAQEIDICHSNKFGPYPCHHLRHFNICPNKCAGSSDILVYQGGRSSGKYDDRDLVSVSYDDHVEKFELTSEVIGIVTVNNEYDGPDKNGVVLICTKCEVIGIDLNEKSLKVLQPKHFLSINNSNPTTHSTAIDIEENVWNRLATVSKAFWATNHMSDRDWPLFFQKSNVAETNSHRVSYRQVYLSGHSNGNICVWQNGGVNMSLLLVIRTSLEFEQGSLIEKENEVLKTNTEQRESQVRKIGFYDPFDDDEELCITRIILDPKSGILMASNRGGYLFTYELSENSHLLPTWKTVSIANKESVSDIKPKPVLRNNELLYPPGYQPRRPKNSIFPLVVFMPSNGRITEIAYLHKHSCLAVGSTQGIAFLDAEHGYVVHTDDFNYKDQNALDTGTNQIQRFKSFKKSLRKTFRRKKRTGAQATICNYPEEKEQFVEATEPEGFVEREICARDDNPVSNNVPERTIGSVTCLQTMRFPLVDSQNVDDVIAVGLSEGVVYFFTIIGHENTQQTTFKTEQIKKISIPYRQPILNINITNEEGYFSASTRLVVITDEQLRVYQCHPLLKRESYKLTALEGLKIKNGTISKIPNKKNKTSFESFVVLLANNGTIRVHSCHKPSQFFTRDFVDPHNSLALNSTCLTKDGSLFYLIRSSELKRSTINSMSRGWSIKKDN